MIPKGFSRELQLFLRKFSNLKEFPLFFGDSSNLSKSLAKYLKEDCELFPFMESQQTKGSLIPLESFLYFPKGEELIYSTKKGQRIRRIFDGTTQFEKQEKEHLEKFKPMIENEAEINNKFSGKPMSLLFQTKSNSAQVDFILDGIHWPIQLGLLGLKPVDFLQSFSCFWVCI